MGGDESATVVRASGPWAAWWRGWYRALRYVEGPLLWLVRRHGFGNLVVVRVTGRRSGRLRELPLGLLRVAGRRYLGHPSGDCPWTRDVRAGGRVAIQRAGQRVARFRAVVLQPGPERDAVVRASFRQHPFPGNAFYRLAGRHVAATGVFFRLEAED
jgi:hypothetical protein